jgi:hypothetical protein
MVSQVVPPSNFSNYQKPALSHWIRSLNVMGGRRQKVSRRGKNGLKHRLWREKFLLLLNAALHFKI